MLYFYEQLQFKIITQMKTPEEIEKECEYFNKRELFSQLLNTSDINQTDSSPIKPPNQCYQSHVTFVKKIQAFKKLDDDGKYQDQLCLQQNIINSSNTKNNFVDIINGINMPKIPYQDVQTCQKHTPLNKISKTILKVDRSSQIVEGTNSKKSLIKDQVSGQKIIQNAITNDQKTIQIERIPKIKRIKKKTFVTNNILPPFKKAVISYIKKYAKNVSSYEFLNKITQKTGISMQDYQNIFKQDEFQSILSQMFRQKYLLRVLMLSRVKNSSKKIFITKINVFENAFKTRRFRNIN